MRPAPAPLSRVFELGSEGRSARSAFGALATILAHGGIALVVFWCGDLAALSAPLEVQEFNIEREPEKVAPPPDPPPPEQAAKPTPPPKPAPEDPPESEPAPEAAQSGALLTKEADENEPEDSYDDTFVTGDNDRYAGGMTANLGKSLSAVYGPGARVGGVPGGTGSAAPPPPPTPDLSRLPTFGTNSFWDDCGFPWEADRDRIDHAVAQIAVTVRADGTADSVDVVYDPGHGFGRVAKACALKKHWDVGLDHDGHPITARTKAFNVRFNRD